MGKFTWTSQRNGSNFISDLIGPGYHYDDIYECDPFALSDNDYINGYRVIYDLYIYGIYFYTNLNETYDCIAENITNTYEHTDTGIIILDNHYLSGFIFDVGWIIDGFQLQFTAFPTIAPSQSPTNAPTSTPSIAPTITPTIANDGSVHVDIIESTMKQKDVYAGIDPDAEKVNIWVIMTITLGIVVLICGIIMVFVILRRNLLQRRVAKELTLQQVASVSNGKRKWMNTCNDRNIEVQIKKCKIVANVYDHDSPQSIWQSNDETQTCRIDACMEGDGRAMPETASGTIQSDMAALPGTTQGPSDGFDRKQTDIGQCIMSQDV